MSTPNPFAALFQTFLAVLKGDFLQMFGGPLLTFLQADAAAGGDIAKILAAYTAFQAAVATALPANAPEFVAQLGQLNTAIATLLAARLQGLLTAQASATANAAKTA